MVELNFSGADVFFQKLDESLNKVWESGVLSQERLDELRKIDIRKHSFQFKNLHNEKNHTQESKDPAGVGTILNKRFSYLSV